MKNRSGPVLLGIVCLLYLVSFFFDSDLTRAALGESLHFLKFIVPILLLVFFLMALLNTFVDEKAIAKHIGEGSALKGWIIALGSGILSHGPGYIWYPLLQELRKKGAKDGLMFAFLYARAIKIPWIPMMVSYFGAKFTLVFSVYIIIGAVVQGLIADRFKIENKS